jgi:hypothetical protein|tara:strand:+ start:272 stop:562 length:291 start_codon:yes stop_codon:yes gene_type:complete
MSTTYTWSFPSFETDSENKVKNIHWRYTAVDGEHSASMYGSCAGSEGMNFDAMTKESATACVLEMSDTTEENMKSNLDAQIASQKAPELTSKTKDW